MDSGINRWIDCSMGLQTNRWMDDERSERNRQGLREIICNNMSNKRLCFPIAEEQAEPGAEREAPSAEGVSE